jgi:hypothetical protein
VWSHPYRFDQLIASAPWSIVNLAFREPFTAQGVENFNAAI